MKLEVFSGDNGYLPLSSLSYASGLGNSQMPTRSSDPQLHSETDMIAFNAVRHNYTVQIASSGLVKTVKSESELISFCEQQIHARALFSEA